MKYGLKYLIVFQDYVFPSISNHVLNFINLNYYSLHGQFMLYY